MDEQTFFRSTVQKTKPYQCCLSQVMIKSYFLMTHKISTAWKRYGVLFMVYKINGLSFKDCLYCMLYFFSTPLAVLVNETVLVYLTCEYLSAIPSRCIPLNLIYPRGSRVLICFSLKGQAFAQRSDLIWSPSHLTIYCRTYEVLLKR